MNVAAIHPYPGYNRSFEEEGTLAAIQALRGLMTSNGAAAMPIFITESGWWSDGEQSFYDVGNWAPREWILLEEPRRVELELLHLRGRVRRDGDRLLADRRAATRTTT